MSFSDTWLPESMAALGNLRNRTPSGAPMLSGLDTVSVLGVLAQKGVKPALQRFLMTANGEIGTVMLRTDDLEDGVIEIVSAMTAISAGRTCGIDEYLTGHANPVTWRRSKVSVTVGPITVQSESYEPWIVDRIGAETDLLSFVRQLVADWQRAVNASAACIRSCGADVSISASPEAIDTFVTTLRTLCASLDVLGENPPLSYDARLVAGAKAAWDTTSQFVGETAADLADAVGRTAGGIGAGFFSSVGAVGLVVAGLAVYMVIT